MNTKLESINNILLVEYDPRDVKITLAALAKYRLAKKVVVVNNAAAALDYLYCRGKFELRPRGNPSLVLLDHKMSKVTGLEVLETIKSDEGLKTIPVQVLNARRI